MANTPPLENRDFSQGRITTQVIATSLVPANSVKDSLNVAFDEVVGAAKVRFGTTRLGTSITTAGFLPQGLANFVPHEGGLGPTIVTNGTFTGSASGWTLGDGWAYNSNNVIFTPLGSELVTNGTFSGSATGWTLGTGWTYGSNHVTYAVGSPTVTTYTSDTTYNPPVTLTSVIAEVYGAGGGGGGGKVTTSFPGLIAPAGGDGSLSSFSYNGLSVVGNGGAGGGGGTSSKVGTGGTATGGDVNTTGAQGVWAPTSGSPNGGNGGGTGAGTGGGPGNGGTGAVSIGTGGGGGYGNATNNYGGSGGGQGGYAKKTLTLAQLAGSATLIVGGAGGGGGALTSLNGGTPGGGGNGGDTTGGGGGGGGDISHIQGAGGGGGANNGGGGGGGGASPSSGGSGVGGGGGGGGGYQGAQGANASGANGGNGNGGSYPSGGGGGGGGGTGGDGHGNGSVGSGAGGAGGKIVLTETKPLLYQNIGTTTGLSYLVVANVGGSVGTVTISLGGTTQTVAAGTNFSQVMVAGSGPEITFNGSNDFVSTIDNVSVKVFHDGTLSQSLPTNAGQTYQTAVAVGGSAGYVSVTLGSDFFTIPAGSSLFQNLIAGLGGIVITPSVDFNGTVDNVTVKQVFKRLLLVVYNGIATATLYYYDGVNWNTSSLTTLANNTRNRMTTLGGFEFLTNEQDGMYSSPDAATWSQGAANDCIEVADATPSLIFRYKQRLLAAGDPALPDRIFFSSIIDPTSTPFITWDTNPTTGNWIDVNPDDGGNITGFAETSTFCLVFKDTGMYRLDTVAKTVDPDNIFNVGAVSQEVIVTCMGVTYFFSGNGIYRTNGGYPEQISRAGVQDLIQALTPAQWANVRGGTDGLNVYYSLGDVDLFPNQTNARTITNAWIKFSPRDQTWSVHSYRDYFAYFDQYTNGDGPLMRGATDNGDVQTVNLGVTDEGTQIAFYLETQDQEMGLRAHSKGISNMLGVYTNNGLSSWFGARQDGGTVKPIIMSLNKRINVSTNVNLQGNYFNFVWSGTSDGASPVLEGYVIEQIQDQGFGDAQGESDSVPPPVTNI